MVLMIVLEKLDRKDNNTQWTYLQHLFGSAFTPQPLRVVRVLFSPMVSGWVGGPAFRQPAGRREKVCPGFISETVRCRKLINGMDIG